jgi:hypothetical protein
VSESILTRARPLVVARLAGALSTPAVPIVLARGLLPAAYGTFGQAHPARAATAPSGP